jgi:hypothetical protein
MSFRTCDYDRPLHPAAQSRSVSGDQAAPDTVLADVPVLQGQGQAVAAYWAGRADSDRRGCFLAGPAGVGADREPLIGIEAGIRTLGVPDH